MSSRRDFLKTAGRLAAAGTCGVLRTSAAEERHAGTAYELLTGARQSARREALAGTDSLIKRTYRPPNYESPIEYFDNEFTANRHFFVRYHLSNIPKVAAEEWRLQVGGVGQAKAMALSLRDLRQRFARVEVSALCYCAGNRRGFMEPHVPGIQWGHGAMGNARWAGVRLRDVLHELDLAADTMEIVFRSADRGVMEKTPPFVKSLPLTKALHPDTLIALEMNGEPLPYWHGAPARLVVPGWVATYWVKHLTAIAATSQPCDAYWMQKAYRLPAGKFGTDDRFSSQLSSTTTPVTELLVNSLITRPTDRHVTRLNQGLHVQGWAWDGGQGIATVALSTNGGQDWQEAELGPDHGPYAWRSWQGRVLPKARGVVTLLARATNRRGQTQGMSAIANPSGYHHNAMASVRVLVQ